MSARRGYVVLAHRTHGSPSVTLADTYPWLHRSRPAAEAQRARLLQEKAAGGWTGVQAFEVCEVRTP